MAGVEKRFSHDNWVIYAAGYVNAQVGKDVVQHLFLRLKVGDDISIKLRP